MARNIKTLIFVWSAAALYLWSQLRHRWVPHDDGGLGQAADWINQGLLPHRDFIDVYTGGLSELHALAFRLLGPSLLTLRLVLFVAFLLWVPTIFYIASRVAGTIAAALITLLAVAWSVPNYPASMPSWYNLFLATAGVAALFRYMEDPRARWLVAAGVCGGLSFLMKVVGLYYVAGVLLYLVYRTRTASPGEERATAYSVFVTVSLVLFVAVLLLLIRRAFRPGEVLQFVAPSAAIAAFLIQDEWTHRSEPSARRFARLFSQILPFAAGVAAPIALFLIPYLFSGSTGAFINGVFLLPMRRFSFATQPAPALSTLWPLIPIAGWAMIASRLPTRFDRGAALVAALLLTGLLLATGTNAQSYEAVWYAARNTLPVLAAIGVIVLARRPVSTETNSLTRERAALLVCVTAVCALVQFPFASTIYFSYIAPLVALTALAFFGFADTRHRPSGAALAAFLIAFAVFRTNGTDLRYFGVEYHPQGELKPLRLERGGIMLPAIHADVYEALSSRLRAVSKNGYIWASPDAPEVYFLSGLSSVSRAPYAFFDDSQTNEASVLAAIDSHGITAVVIQTQPPFSPPITESLYRQLARRFPLGQRLGPFILMWRQ